MSKQVSDPSIEICTFYRFADLSEVRESLREELQALKDIRGLVLIAPEGINGTVAAPIAVMQRFKDILQAEPKLADLEYKTSWSEKYPFPRWKVELKDQTIQYVDKFRPDGSRPHLTPAEWHAMLQGDEEVTVLDTRNTYEVKVGTFKNAIDPGIEKFTEFADYLDECELPKDKPTLIFCTGGIRCEKAILDMEERGFDKVYQLEGGILKYLEEYPEGEFEGECFVFDRRVAVDKNLAPSEQYWLCPHCGNPGQLECTCAQCDQTARVCEACASQKPTCSKNCQYHYERTRARS